MSRVHREIGKLFRDWGLGRWLGDGQRKLGRGYADRCCWCRRQLIRFGQSSTTQCDEITDQAIDNVGIWRRSRALRQVDNAARLDTRAVLNAESLLIRYQVSDAHKVRRRVCARQIAR